MLITYKSISIFELLAAEEYPCVFLSCDGEPRSETDVVVWKLVIFCLVGYLCFILGSIYWVSVWFIPHLTGELSRANAVSWQVRHFRLLVKLISMLNSLDYSFNRFAKNWQAIICSPKYFLGARFHRSSYWRTIKLTILHHDVSKLLLIERFWNVLNIEKVLEHWACWGVP